MREQQGQHHPDEPEGCYVVAMDVGRGAAVRPSSETPAVDLRRLAGCILTAGLAMAALAAAQHEPNIDRTHPDLGAATPQTVAIEQLRLSNQLGDFGEAHKDPIALVEAAMILKQTGAVLRPASAGVAGARTWESLLARAAQIAGPNPTVASLIADVRTYKVRSIPTVSGDPSLFNKSVKQKGADRVEVHFRAGAPAVVYVRPVPKVDLDLYVYDEFNNLICRGDGGNHEAECRWRPRWDGQFLVDVHNNNETEVAYVLAINREIKAN